MRSKPDSKRCASNRPRPNDDKHGFGGKGTAASFHIRGAAFNGISLTAGTVQMRYNGSNRRLQKNVINGLETDHIRDQEGRVLVLER